jgi:hypothetical protein
MKYILISLPALVSVASAAEIMGTYYESASPAPASVAEASQATDAPSGEFTVSAATVTQPIAPTQTPEIAVASWAATEEMPYWHLTQSGYQQMECGYGYYKDTQGYCQKESWVRAVFDLHFVSSLICVSVGLQYAEEECYETVIINKWVTIRISPGPGIKSLDLSQEEVLSSKSRACD